MTSTGVEGPAVGAGTAPLENLANKCSPFDPSDGRKRRWEHREMLREVTTLRGLRACGQAVIRKEGVSVRYSNGVAGFAGLATCGSVHADPVCSAKVWARRRLQIGTLVAAAQAQGLTCVYGTLTQRHHRGQSLKDLWDALTHGWRRATSGKGWMADVERFGIVGWLRVVETNIGRNGWHVHIHLVAFLRPQDTDVAVELGARMFSRWNLGLAKRGVVGSLPVGQLFRTVDGPADTALAEYFTKGVDHEDLPEALGLELTSAQSKRARSAHSTQSVWSLLPMVSARHPESVALWREHERVSKGRRLFQKSDRLADLLGVSDKDRSDEEIAAEELGTGTDDLVWITREGWSSLVARPQLIPGVLTATERGGLAGLEAYLIENGVSYGKA